MSEASDYIRERLDAVLAGQARLEVKLDRMRDEQVTQRSELSSNKRQLDEHHKILVLGNGQKALTVQLAETSTRLEDVEHDIHAVKKASKVPCDPSELRKERIKTWGSLITVLGLCVNAVVTWFSLGVK